MTFQVVDYRANAPLHVYLAKEYSQQPFDVILDTIGIQALFVNSPAYLKPEGLHVNVGAYEGHLRTLLLWSMNVWLPKLLGGIPRKYIMFSTPPNKERLELLAKMVEEGKLKGVVDGPFEMEDALNVSIAVHVKAQVEMRLQANRVDRHTTDSGAKERRESSW